MLFFQYIIFGFSIAMPVGAISIEMIKQGLKNGFYYSWMVGLGSVGVDILLMLVLGAGLADVLSSFQTYLWLIGSLFLTYLAYQTIKGENNVGDGERVKKESLKRMFRRGFLIGLSPASIVFWISVLGTSIASVKAESGGVFLISIAIIIGIMCHDISLAFLASRFHKYINEKTSTWVSYVAAVLLMGFAVYFFMNFVNSI